MYWVIINLLCYPNEVVNYFHASLFTRSTQNRVTEQKHSFYKPFAVLVQGTLLFLFFFLIIKTCLSLVPIRYADVEVDFLHSWSMFFPKFSGQSSL